MNFTSEKGFTLAEFLIIIFLMGILSIFIVVSSAKATASQKTTAVIRGLVDCKRAVVAYYTEDSDSEIIKQRGTDGIYFNIVNRGGQKALECFIDCGDTDANFEKKLLRGLAQNAKSLKLYKSLENLSEGNLISADDEKIESPIYMLLPEISSNEGANPAA